MVTTTLFQTALLLIANDSNKRLIAENVRQASHKAAKIKQDAEALAAKVGDLGNRNPGLKPGKVEDIWRK